ncbi:PAS domain-containing protein [Streptomyces sp. NPDC002573]|uniref:PAS domain-containing protein n=1 Tax=Streptomyces sp. NPDC002573 TaxID=3364651 RepID=UPI00368FEA11
MSTDQSRLLEPLRLREISDAAIAMIDEQGTVVAWTRAAQHVVGYCAGDVVGRSVTLVLPFSEEALGVSAFAEQCRAQGGWSGTAAVRHCDGRTLNLSLRLVLLRGPDVTHRWLVSLTDIGAFSSGTVNGSVRESLLTRAPVGIAIRDPELRCTWVNDAMERYDGISRDRRFGRRLKDSLPGFEAEALEAVMRQVLASGTSAVHEYRVWPPEDPRREHAFSASFFCLQDVDGQALGVCSISVDVTSNQRARERLAILSQASTRIGSTLDIMRTAQELASLAVPLLADYVAVDLAEAVPFGKEPSARTDTMHDRPPVFRRAGLASIHPGIPESPFARGVNRPGLCGHRLRADLREVSRSRRTALAADGLRLTNEREKGRSRDGGPRRQSSIRRMRRAREAVVERAALRGCAACRACSARWRPHPWQRARRQTSSARTASETASYQSPTSAHTRL